MSIQEPSSTLWTKAGRAFAKMVSMVLVPESAQQFQISHQRVYLSELPETFESLRIVHLSDIHFYEYGSPEYYQHVVDTVNGLDADIIVTTGDIIHYGHDYLGLGEFYLKQMQAKIGKWGCLGNHDYSDDANSFAVREMKTGSGFNMLINQAIPIEKEGKRIWLSGIDDYKHGRPDWEDGFSPIDPDEAHVCLIHNPQLAPFVSKAPKAPNIILAGHTHGGQIDHFLVTWAQKNIFHQPYLYGWFNLGSSNLYVTSGIGSATFSFHTPQFDFALYPFRVGTTPEIVVYELTGQREETELAWDQQIIQPATV